MYFRQLGIKNSKSMFFSELYNEIMYIISMGPYARQHWVAIRKFMRYTPGTKIEVFDFIIWNIINFWMNFI